MFKETLAKPLIIFLYLLSLREATLTLQNQIALSTAQITSIVLSLDNSSLIVGSKDTTWKVLNLASNTLSWGEVESGQVTGLGINPTNGQIMVLVKDGNVKYYHFSNFSLAGSYTYPNSGYANTIQFLTDGTGYFLAGNDGSLVPKIHRYDLSHTLQSSQDTTTFTAGSAITEMMLFFNQLIWVRSDASSAPFTIENYAYSSGALTLVKAHYSSEAAITGFSIAYDGTKMYSVAEDYSIKTYEVSAYSSLYMETQSEYKNTAYGLLKSVNAFIPNLFFIGGETHIFESFTLNDFSSTSETSVSSPVVKMLNLYPTLVTGSSDGKLAIYAISFYDGTDPDDTKWIILAAVLSSVIALLLVGLAFEVRMNKLKEESQMAEEENAGLNDEIKGGKIHPSAEFSGNQFDDNGKKEGKVKRRKKSKNKKANLEV